MVTSNSCDEASKQALLRQPTVVVIVEIKVTISPDGTTEVDITPPHPCIQGEVSTTQDGKPVLVLSALCPALVYFNKVVHAVYKPGPFMRREFWRDHTIQVEA